MNSHKKMLIRIDLKIILRQSKKAEGALQEILKGISSRHKGSKHDNAPDSLYDGV